MSIQQHLETLGGRHARLDAAIAVAARRPGVDDLDVSRMKRERLQLKDEIARAR